MRSRMADRKLPEMASRLAQLAGVCLLAGTMLAGCGGATEYAPQKWGNLDVVVESRPNPPAKGMNEFLVTVTDQHGLPGSDMVVSLRANPHDAWTQAIQDGQMGVYRRAVPVDPAVDTVLQVRLDATGKTAVLDFPFDKH